MSDLYKPLAESIAKLGKIFLFRRKKVLSDAKTYLEKIKNEIESIREEKEVLTQQNEVRMLKIRNMEIDIALKESEKKSIREEKEKLARQNEEKAQKIRDMENDIALKEKELESVREEKEELVKQNEEKAQEIHDMENDIALKEKELESVREEKEELVRQNEEKAQEIRKFDMVSDALKARPNENGFIKEFENLINGEFKELCDKEAGISINDMIEGDRLRHILDQMQLIAKCPGIHSKSIGAIGGGYSSGKSSFINSFITNSKLRLAVGINPVTAIPSYVISDKETKVKGITYKGGEFEIPLTMYKSISHDFLKSFSFNLSEIILHTTVLCPLKDELFNNLCIIDTPGYNPPAKGRTEHDIDIAKKYLKDNARFLIWMIGLDSNGTIPSSDLSFLYELDGFGKPGKRPLYIIANKAEAETEDNLEKILDNFEQVLNKQGFEYVGISAYDSIEKQEYLYRKMSITEFLQARNVPSRKFRDLNTLLERVFEDYREKIRQDDAEKHEKRKEVHTLLLDAFEGNIISDEQYSNKLEEGLNNLIQYFQPGKVEERLEFVDSVSEKFKQCFISFCQEMGMDLTV